MFAKIPNYTPTNFIFLRSAIITLFVEHYKKLDFPKYINFGLECLSLVLMAQCLQELLNKYFRFQKENPSLLVESWVCPQLDIRLPIYGWKPGVGGIFFLLWPFSVACMVFVLRISVHLNSLGKAAAHVAVDL